MREQRGTKRLTLATRRGHSAPPDRAPEFPHGQFASELLVPSKLSNPKLGYTRGGTIGAARSGGPDRTRPDNFKPNGWTQWAIDDQLMSGVSAGPWPLFIPGCWPMVHTVSKILLIRSEKKAPYFPDMPCMKRFYKDKKASVHWSAARKKERFSSHG